MSKKPFNWSLYIEKQTQAILERLQSCDKILYLEVGGHFLIDNHASRVLPGYITDSKAQIFQKLSEYADLSIIFCINAKDLIWDRQLSPKYISFEKYLFKELASIKDLVKEKESIKIAITMLSPDFIPPQIRELERELQSQWYHTYHKYMIDDYPNNINLILSDQWYWKDDHIPNLWKKSSEKKSLILVAACASNSGKLNTCLSQLYWDYQIKLQSQYAKFETFPIRNLPLDHPINLSYEAATADIGDYNMLDPYYTAGESVNYNRDIEAFEVIKIFSEKIWISPLWEERGWGWGSPTAMWINTAGFCLMEDEESKKAITDACRAEIESRLTNYTKLANSWHGEEDAIEKCKQLLKNF